MGTNVLMSQSTDLQERFDRYYQRYYSTEADQYDKVRFHSSEDEAEYAAIYRLLGLHSGQSVLDAPAGTGRVATYLARQGLRVTALDLTENMLREGQMRAFDAGLSDSGPSHTMSSLAGNARQLPFDSARFDGVISIRFFHLLPIALHRQFLLDMWRVLRPGGVLLVQYRSALTGGAMVWLHELSRRYREGRKPRYYLWPHEVSSLFEGMGKVSLHGIEPVGIRFAERLEPNGAAMLTDITRNGWSTFLTHRRIFVRVVKGG